MQALPHFAGGDATALIKLVNSLFNLLPHLVLVQFEPRLLGVLRVSPEQSSSKITHVVIIFQENRTTDDLFNGFPGADTARLRNSS